jgi:osomolarity two-component system sensor histidine kinase NIK1
MTVRDETLAAAATILQGLARDGILTDDTPPPSNNHIITTNGFDSKKLKLPGESTPEKQAFESELEALVRRVHDLELEVVSHSIRPYPSSSSSSYAFFHRSLFLCLAHSPAKDFIRSSSLGS